MIFVFDTVENIVEKGENAGYQHFLLFSQCFQRAFYPGPLKVRTVWERVTGKFHYVGRVPCAGFIFLSAKAFMVESTYNDDFCL